MTVTPTPPDGPVTVNILHPTTGATVETLNGNMTGGRMETTWNAKAQTANWRTDRIRFHATATSPGVSGDSTNQFTFRQRPTVASALRNIDRGASGHFATLCEKVDAALEASRVHYVIKFKLTGTFTAAQQADAKTRIETIWNDGFSTKKFHRTHCVRGRTCDCAFDCCKADFRIDVNWVASGEHDTVAIHASASDSHSYTSCGTTDWADPPIAVTTSFAHETGHMLGQFDEYTGGNNDPTGVQPVNPAADNLMKTAGDTTLFNRHYRWVLEYLNANSGGDTYEIIPP